VAWLEWCQSEKQKLLGKKKKTERNLTAAEAKGCC